MPFRGSSVSTSCHHSESHVNCTPSGNAVVYFSLEKEGRPESTVSWRCSSIPTKDDLNPHSSLGASDKGEFEMRKCEQRSRIRCVKSDFIPGTDVLAVERKETGPPFGATPSNPDPAIVRDAKPESPTPGGPVPYPYEPALDPPTPPLA